MMKTGWIWLLLALLTTQGLFAHEMGEHGPIFSEGKHPLTGIQAFLILSADTLQESVEPVLARFGEVMHLQGLDMRGFGAGTVLLVQMGNVTAWNGDELPVTRISLQVQMTALLRKTGLETFPVVWSIHTFARGEAEVSEATQKLVGEFAQSYSHANQELKRKPVFYIYD